MGQSVFQVCLRTGKLRCVGAILGSGVDRGNTCKHFIMLLFLWEFFLGVLMPEHLPTINLEANKQCGYWLYISCFLS